MEEESLTVTAQSGVFVSQENDLAIVAENGEGSYEKRRAFRKKGDAPSSDISEEDSSALIACYKKEIQDVKQRETESREWACNAKNEDKSPRNAAECEYITMVMGESEKSEIKMEETKTDKERSELAQEVPENKIEDEEFVILPGKPTEQVSVAPVGGNEEEDNNVDDSKPLETEMVPASPDKSDETRIEWMDTTYQEAENDEGFRDLPPVVVEKRPISFPMESPFSLQEYTDVKMPMEEDNRAPIENAAPEVLETTYVELQMKRVFNNMETPESGKVVEEEIPEIIEKRPVSLHMEAMFDEEIEEKTMHNDWEQNKATDAMSLHIEERVCLIEHRGVQEAFEDVPVDGDAGTKPPDSRVEILESSPVVIEKRPMSLHMEERVCQTENKEVQKAFENVSVDDEAVTKQSDNDVKILESSPVVIQKRPMSLHMEERLCLTKHREVQEAFEDVSVDEVAVMKTSDGGVEILESSPVVIEKRPMSLHMEERVCQTENKEVQEAFENVSVDDEAVTKQFDNDVEILESSPVVIQKRPMSLHMEERVCQTERRDIQEAFEDVSVDEGAVMKTSDGGVEILESSPVVIEKRPMSLHMEERLCLTEHREVQEAFEDVTVDDDAVRKQSDIGVEILESSPVVIQKRPMSLHMEERVCLTEHRDVQGPFEDVSVDDDAVRKQSDNDVEILESSPVVIQKRPMSLHMEERVCQTEHRDVQEAFEDVSVHEGAVMKTSDGGVEILESSPVVIQKRPMSLHMEERVCQTEHRDVQEPFEDVTVDDDAVIKPSDIGVEILESSPVVIQKRPMSLHMEERVCQTEHRDVQEPFEDVTVDDDAVIKPSDIGVEILESSPVVIQKRPMSLHMEERVCLTEHELQGPFENVPADDDAVTKPSDSDVEILESPPLVVQKRPTSLHVEERIRLADDGEGQEPIEDAPPEVVVKRPFSLHMEAIFDGDAREELVEEDKVAAETEVMEAEYVDTESEKVERLLKQARELADKKRLEIAQPIEDAVPVVLEKRPVSLHMESLFNDHETCESREPIEERISTGSAEKTKSESVLIDRVFAPVYKTSKGVEVEVEGDPKREIEVDEPSKEREEEKLQDSEQVGSHEDGDLEEPFDITCTIEEASPLVVEKKPFPFQQGSIFVDAVAKSELELKDDEDDVSQTSESTLVDDDLELRVENALVSTEALVQEIANKGTASRTEPIQDVSPVVLEKRPLSLHMEKVFNVDVTEERTEKTEDRESRAVSLERDVKAPATELASEDLRDKIQRETSEASIEESPPAFEGNRKGSIHMETTFDPLVAKAVEEESSVHFLEQERVEKEPKPDEYLTYDALLIGESKFIPEDNRNDEEPIEKTVPAVIAEKPQEPSLLFDKSDLQEKVFKERDYENKGDEETDETQVILQKETDEAQTDDVASGRKVNVVSTFHMIINVKDHQEENVEQGNNMQLETTGGDAVKLELNSDSEAIKNEEIVNKVADKTPGAVVLPKSDHPDEEHDNALVAADQKTAGVIPPDVPAKEYDAERGTAEHVEVSDRVQETVEPAAVKKRSELLVELTMPEAHDKEGEKKNQGNSEESRVGEYETKNQEVKESDLHILEPEIQDVQYVEEPTRKCVEDVEIQKRVSNGFVFGEEKSNQNKQADEELKRENEGKKEIDEEAKRQLEAPLKQETLQEEVVKTEQAVFRECFEGGVKIQERVHETKTVEVTTKTSRSTTKQKVSSISYSKGFEEDAVTTRSDDHSPLARQVLKKRLSAPEVLPEKENEGCAPLAASEGRGILESQEQFTVEKPKEAENNNTAVMLNKDETPKAADAVENVTVSPGHDVESGDVGGAGGTPDSDRPHLILIKAGQHRKREKGINEKKDETRSPRATCCSLM